MDERREGECGGGNMETQITIWPKIISPIVYAQECSISLEGGMGRRGRVWPCSRFDENKIP